ncbi:hypothetical protein GCM10011591_34570 [Nocardia camponoti]|uniref:Mammalian cell entry protein n=1 Tax=Nocardia camponoti TaxID=1616106 RepID=A0A917QN04_9NOCA|nr:hypothetical protein GCM10011591_34570 [Nocardia camponoti]
MSAAAVTDAAPVDAPVAKGRPTAASVDKLSQSAGSAGADGPSSGGADGSPSLAKVAVAEGDSAESVADDAGRRKSVGALIGLAAASIAVIALVVGAVFTTLAARSAAHSDDLREQYTATARQAVINLTTIRADSAKADIDRILSLASGEFKSEFDGRVDPFMSVVQQAKVSSTGEVVESGIESADDQSAKVLVAAKQMVSNTGSAEPQARQYRFRITVSNGPTGMTVSKVEFVG